MTAEAIRTIGIRDLDHAAKRAALAREFLVTNGLGGYASGTIGGVPARRYHALLVAGLPPPFGRRVLLVDFVAEVATAEWRAGVAVRRRRRASLRLPSRRRFAGLALRARGVRAREAHRDAASRRIRCTSSIGCSAVARGWRSISRSSCTTARTTHPWTPRCLGHSRFADTQWGYEISVLDLPHLRLRVLGREARSRSAAATCPRSRTDGRSRGYEPCGTRFAIGQAFARRRSR